MPKKKVETTTLTDGHEATVNLENLENTDLGGIENLLNKNDELELNVSGAEADAELGDVYVEPYNEVHFVETPIKNSNNDGVLSYNDEIPDSENDTAADITQPDSEQNSQPGRPRRQRTPAQTSPSVLTIEIGAEVMTEKDKEETIWHEIKNSQVTGTPLTGVLGRVEFLESGAVIAIVEFKGQRIAIPTKEMMINLERLSEQSDEEYNERLSRILNRMMGAEIDFVVRGITGTGGERAAVASRKAAMLRMRRRYYINESANGKPLVHQERIVEARVVAVSQVAIRVEIFGVETSIHSRDLSWSYLSDVRDSYFVGDIVQVRINRIDGDSPENLLVRADIRSLITNNTREKLKTLKPQTNCIGEVTGVHQGIIFIRLVDGVNAVAHKCYDQRKPGRGDTVLFVVVRVDDESGNVLGLVARIIKRNI